MLDYKIYGNSIQNGTPSPDNPVEIQSVGDLVTDENDANYGKYKIPVEVTGKNLISMFWFDRHCGSYWYSTNIQNSRVAINRLIEVKPNTYYTISVSNFNLRYAIQQYNKNIELTNDSYWQTSSNYTFLTTDNTYFIWIPISSPNYSYDITFEQVQQANIQIEEGATATEYEPYQKPKTTNIYLDQPLRKIGDYADYIDFKNNKVIKKIVSANLTATSVSGVGSNDDTVSRFYQSYTKRLVLNILDNIQVMSNKLQALSVYNYNSASNKSINSISCNQNNTAIHFKMKNDLLGITEDMTNDEKKNKCNEYLSNNPVTINYILKNQTEQNITLPEILMHKGTNIITVDTTIEPSRIEAEYSSFEKEVP